MRVREGSYALAASALAAGTWGRWYWRAQGDACDECSELDGSSYDSEDEIDERPHPNCQCEVEYVIQSQHRDKWTARHGKKKPFKKKRPRPFRTKDGRRKR